MLTGGLIAVGKLKHWLTGKEFALSVALLLIPYLTRSFENCMASHARFSAVVFPVFIVVARLFENVPIAITMMLVGVCGFLTAIYAAMFGAGYGVY